VGDGHGDRAVPVGAPERDAVRGEPRQRRRRGVAVAVVRADAYHADRRPELVEPAVARAAGAAVVADLEERHAADPAREQRLRRQPRVPGEQGAEAAVLHQQHYRVLVQVAAPLGPGRIRVEHGEAHAVEGEPLPRAPGMPPDVPGLEVVEEGAVDRVGDQLGRLADEPRRQAVDQRLRAAEMIEVGVRDHEHVHGPRPHPPEEGEDDLPAGVPPCVARPRVDHDPMAAGRPDGGGVALPHVEKM
jgi:hypothetical protein